MLQGAFIQLVAANIMSISSGQELAIYSASLTVGKLVVDNHVSTIVVHTVHSDL